MAIKKWQILMAMGLPLFMSFTVYSEDSPVDLSLEQDRKDLEKSGEKPQ